MAEVEIVALAKLRAAPWNPRTITKDRFENLKRALQADPQMLRLRPVLATIDGTIYGGNYRFKAAQDLGAAWCAEQFGSAGVPAVLEDITPEQARERALRDNGQWGDWEEQQLAEMLYRMKEEGVEIATLGLPEREISRLLDSVSGTHIGGEDDDEIEIPVEPATRLGDLIELGRHRLICGDGTDRATLSRLLGGDHKVSMAFTDPPWNVGIGEDENPRHKQRPGLRNDSLAEKDYGAFLTAAAAALAAVVAGDTYVVMGGEQWPTLDAALRGAGFHWSGTIIWAKDIFVLGRANYHRQYEPIWYGWPKRAKSTFQGARDLSDLWTGIARPRRSDEHPSMKPVELVERAIKNSSERGDTVLDIFGGSGSTLLAAERSERACRMAEIDPGFCDVVVTRWEKQTGARAVRPEGSAAAATPTSEPTPTAVRPR